MFLKHLISSGIENVMSLSKTEVKLMSSDFTLHYGQDISKDNVINIFSSLMLITHDDASNEVLSVVEE